ncbi:MAG: polysaccharide biosynthesis tyrosine autokinase [Thermodesulfobacteriota bacterium]|nr:polysaccharide biosynthesis tyrosine autokinase [Thermodesulfobacteriota bacterium]
MYNNPSDELQDEIDIRDLWRVILKRRWVIITLFAVVVTTVAIYTLTLVPVYCSTAQILIERTNPNILSIQEMLAVDPSGQDFYQTQHKILQSRFLASEVIKRLNLASYQEFKPEEKGDESALISQIKGAFKHLNIVRSRRPDIENKEYEAPFLGEDPSFIINDMGLVGAFLGRLKVEPVHNTRLVNIGFESADPRLSALAVNTLIQAYIDWNLGLRLKGQKAASRFLDQQVKEAKRKLAASELALQQYREKYGIAVVGSQTGKDAGLGQDLSKQKVMKINEQLLDVKNKRIEAEIKYKQASDLLKDPSKGETIPEVVNNPIIISINHQEVQLLREKAEKSERYGPKHPFMVALDQEIKNLRKQKLQEIKNIVESMKGNYEIALSQEHALEKALSLGQKETISRDKIAIQYQVFKQEVESNRNFYDMLLKRLKEANVVEENKSVNIHVLNFAGIPNAPVKPNVKRNLVIAIVLGLFMGGGAAFFVEYMDDTVKTPEDLEKGFDLVCLGPVPKFTMKGSDFDRPELIVLNEPKSSASEAYKVLRTGVHFSTPGRSILITSSGPGEGKTITCANLSIAMALSGQKTLVLDGDMRKPRLHRLFDIENERGISNILVGEGDWHDIRIPTNIKDLDFIPSGPLSPNPAELIESKRMPKLIKEFLDEYDYVIIDSPPVVAVTDPVILSHIADGVVLVIELGVTRRGIIADAVRQLRGAHAHILGVVLNNIKIGKDRYYYRYKYYTYGEDSAKGKKKKRRSPIS